jgi:hypothetical protein
VESEEPMPTDKLLDVSPMALRMSSPFNAGWLAGSLSGPTPQGGACTGGLAWVFRRADSSVPLKEESRCKEAAAAFSCRAFSSLWKGLGQGHVFGHRHFFGAALQVEVAA